MKKGFLIFLPLVMLIGCASMKNGGLDTSRDAKTGFLKGYYSKLGPGPEDGVKMRWIKPGVDWAKYDKIMLDSVVFFFDDASEYKGIEPYEAQQLAEGFNQAFVDTLRDHYPVVTEPGPGVLRIRFAITDLKQNHPVLSGLTTVVPMGLGVSVIKKGVTGSWSGSGAASAEMMALDSMTNDVIAVAQDTRSAGFSNRFTKWGSAGEAFNFWAQRVKKDLDQVHGRP